MIINGHTLVEKQPIKGMLEEKLRNHGVSYGLAEAGYDIRIKQDVWFEPYEDEVRVYDENDNCISISAGRFTIASTIEEFDMPNDLVAIVHDKSTWARQGLSVFNTVIEPGWKGFLTLELVYHGEKSLRIPAGAGIAQVIFHKVQNTAAYDGKYQNQADRPVAAISA